MTELEHLPYRATTRERDYALVQAWCEEQFGEFDMDWYRIGRDPMADLMEHITTGTWKPDVYYFRTQEQQLLFILKWA